MKFTVKFSDNLRNFDKNDAHDFDNDWRVQDRISR